MGRVAVFAVLLALLTWFLHRRLVRATGIPRRWARLADTALVVLAVSTLIGVGSGEVFRHRGRDRSDLSDGSGWLRGCI